MSDAVIAKTKICIDAGHYGKYNRSPVVKDYFESEMTWNLHLKLKAALEKYGFEVITTRKDQAKDLEVYERGKLAKGCDLFISLHSNACDSESVDRVSVFHSFDNKNNSEVLASRFAAGVAELMEVSKGVVCTRVGITGKNEYYGVLRGARNVGCPLYYIIEHSFHTNKRAAEWLLQDENLQRLAVLEAGIIADYYGVKKPEGIKGDVNGDGVVDAFDYQILKAAVLGNITLTDAQKERADYNGDGSVDAFDYMMVKNAVLRKG